MIYCKYVSVSCKRILCFAHSAVITFLYCIDQKPTLIYVPFIGVSMLINVSLAVPYYIVNFFFLHLYSLLLIVASAHKLLAYITV